MNKPRNQIETLAGEGTNHPVVDDNLRGGRLKLANSVQVVLGALVVAGCSATTTERLNLSPLTTVPKVDLNRYAATPW